jgi:methylthioribose-1-phosphate isomerase
VALACADAGIPFVVAAPWSTVDLTAKSEAEISIEQRAGEEVLSFGGVRTSPDDTEAFNPAFDITPARLITALATETGILEVSSGQPPVRGISAAEKPASRSWETGF